jgi:uncharacterized membrane protein
VFGEQLCVTFPGPPPHRPIEPRYRSTTHLLHLILTILTFGFWAFVWVVVVLVVNGTNASKRAGHEQAMARYERELWAWEEARRAQGLGGGVDQECSR